MLGRSARGANAIMSMFLSCRRDVRGTINSDSNDSITVDKAVVVDAEKDRRAGGVLAGM